MRHIINQDRDQIFPYDEAMHLYIEEQRFNAVYYGHNLMLADVFESTKHLLGTFDGLDEAVREISRIYSCRDELITVSGYCAGGGRL
jgi:hypothetical protein